MMHLTRLMKYPAIAVAFALAAAAGADCTPGWDNAMGTPGMSDGYVAAFDLWDDGAGEALYATGSFGSAGAPGTSQIARWDGTQWTALGTGLQGGYSNTLGTFAGDLFVGGYFNTAGGVPGTAKLARWDGANWHSIGAQLEHWENAVWALREFDDGSGSALYIGGAFVSIAGQPIQHIARWDGTTFTEVGGTIGGNVPLIIFAMEIYDDGSGPALHVGGRFTSIGGISANRIAKWDGEEWHPLGTGIHQSAVGSGVHTMVVFEGDLYVGGQSIGIAGGVPVSNIARWDGQEWHDVGGGVPGVVWDLRIFDDGDGPTLYSIGRAFGPGGVDVPAVNMWTGTVWQPLDDLPNDNCFGAIVYDDTLVIGGSFTAVGDLASNRVAQYVGCPPGIPGDINGDGCVDHQDLAILLAAYGSIPGHPNWNPDADLTGDDAVGHGDLAVLLAHYGEGC